MLGYSFFVFLRPVNLRGHIRENLSKLSQQKNKSIEIDQTLHIDLKRQLLFFKIALGRLSFNIQSVVIKWSCDNDLMGYLP